MLVHFVFSTKGRRRQIPERLQPTMWSFLATVSRQKRMMPIAVGGMDDHAHILVALPSDLDLAKAAQAIKGNSSHWFRREHVKDFAWQQGYGAFSVSHSQLEKTKQYVLNQKEHHKKLDFASEFRALLKKHGIEYDERYLLG
jgi:putative transposase